MESVSCEKVEEASCKVQCGEEVPMPTLPLLFKKMELSGFVEVAHLEFALPLPPPPTHVPFTAQQPAVKFTPFAKDEVAALEEKSALEIVVDAFVMEKRVVVAKMSEELAMKKEPSWEVRTMCF